MEKIKDHVADVIEKIPDYKYFMTVNELDNSSFKLAEKYPDIVKLLKVGETRSGRPLYALRIGDGKNRALWFGCPHPNEPIGTMVIEYLTWQLAENDDLRAELDFTWFFIKATDADGLKLNEGWLKGPFTPLHYAKNYYRPAGNKQVEWTFPINYKTLKFNDPIPETRALMKIIENEKPDFIYSLHNAGFGGVYYYISQKAPLLYPIYYKVAHDQGVPLSLGEPEVPWAKELAKAVYYMVSTPEYYDYLEKHLDKDPAEVIKSGTDSFDYARRFNKDVFELVTEVPYYYDPRIEDLSETEIIRRKAVLDNLEEAKKHYDWLIKKYSSIKDKLKLDTRFRESFEYFISVMPDSIKAEENWAKKAPELERKATVAEVFDNYQVSQFYRLLTLGIFYRMIKAEVESGNDGVLSDLLEEVEGELEERAKKLEKELNYTVIPVKKLVAIQLAAGLYTALYIQVKNTYK